MRHDFGMVVREDNSGLYYVWELGLQGTKEADYCCEVDVEGDEDNH